MCDLMVRKDTKKEKDNNVHNVWVQTRLTNI